MSVSARAKIVIGFKIAHSDFWEKRVKRDRFVSCPHGHRGGEAGKFCLECGGRCSRQEHSKMVVTSGFAKYLGHNDPEKAGASFSEDVYDCEDDQMRAGAFGPDFEIHVVDGDERALGIAPVYCNDIAGCPDMSDYLCLTDNEIEALFARVEKLASQLGIDRYTMLFLATSCN